MAGSKYDASEAAVSSAPAKPSFWTRFKNHYKRFWWAHVIGIIVVVLVIVLPVVYVGYPKIAQEEVHASDVNVTKMAMSDPTPDSFHINQTQILHLDSMFEPTLFAFEANASIAGRDSHFATVTIPQITAVDGQLIHVNQDVSLQDTVHEFGDFCKAIVLNEEVDLRLYGKPELQVQVLPVITVTYNETVTLKGLNQFKGFSLSNVTAQVGTADGEPNMHGKVHLPNPTVLTIPLGNVTLDLSVDGKFVGHSFIDNMKLVPGMNTFSMRSKLDQAVVLKKKANYPSGVMPFDINGNKSVYDGKELPYFTKALRATSMTAHVNISEALVF
ncbi:hypothetical protein PHISP_03426 [Aspergillus sp. HF37]|nr:hypothetical protein PHISP_03426 [Aspergillus sp. HF37]